MSIDEPQILSKHLVEPPVRSIDMHLGNNIVVRAGMNKNGVTIKDAMNAIYKHYKKKVSYLHLNSFCRSTIFTLSHSSRQSMSHN